MYMNNNFDFEEIQLPEVEIPAGTNENEPVKRKRGRPKKDQPTPKPQPTPAQSSKNASSIFDSIKKEVKENGESLNTTSGEIQQTQSVQTTSLIDGYMLLAIMDAFVPSVVKIIFKKKFANVTTEQVMLSDVQKKSLEPLADEMAKYLSGYVNPLYAFFIVSGMMYYNNANEVLNKKK
jgi:hypothetical protein